MPVIDVSTVDTNLGNESVCPFSPPSGWEGGSADYTVLMRSRYSDLMHGQRMIVMSSFAKKHDIKYVGPFAKEAKLIIEALKRNKAKPLKGART